jgi:thiosulfate dehydrogenase
MTSRLLTLVALTVLTTIPPASAACGHDTARDDARPDVTTADSTSHTNPLVAAGAGLEHVRDLVRDPSRDAVPADSQLAKMIRRGRDIMRDTRANAGQYVGNDLSCSNCHLNIGQKDRAWPLVGAATMFPQYRARGGHLVSLEDRIRDCFVRSLNGSAPPFDSDELRAVSAYITWLSDGMPVGREPAWHGRNTIAKANLIPIEKLDVASGRALYETNCVACHGADGAGIDLGTAKPGPLWGPRSWNDGAGAARVYVLAGFIRHAMPLTAPGSLSDTDAQNIAAYIESHDRPRFDGKDGDYRSGSIPVDAVYYPKKYTTNPLRR